MGEQNPGVPPPAPPDNVLLVTAPGTGASISGRAYMTGWYSTGCTVYYFDSDTQTDGSVYVLTDKKVYVLGGPLEFAVEPPPSQYNHPNAPDRDAFMSGANYLQFFNYDTALLFDGGLAWEWQRAQTGKVGLKYQQPSEEPNVDWSLQGPIKFVGECAESPWDFTQVQVGATGSSATDGATADATIWVTIDIDGTLVSVSSDIDPMEWPINESTEQWYEDDDLFRFTCHMPNSMEAIEGYENPVVTDTFNYGLDAQQYFEVYDVDGAPMPGLWVQERFTFATPPFHWGSGVGFEYLGWIYSDYFIGPGTGFQTNWSYTDDDFVWETTTPPLPKDAEIGTEWRGIFGADYFRISITNGWEYPANPPFFDFQHHYFAATRDSHPAGASGIHIGTYRLTMWTNQIFHTKQ